MENEKLKVLVLAKLPPYPPTLGQTLRFYNFTKHLRDYCDLDLIYQENIPPAKELQDIFNDIQVLPATQEQNPARSFPTRLMRRFSSKALIRDNPHAVEFLKERLPAYDAVLSTTHLLPCLDFERTTPIVVDAVDESVLQYWRELPHAPGLKEKMRKLYYLFLNFLYEKRFLAEGYIASAFLTSEVDARVLKRVSNLHQIEVIQNGVDSEYFAPADCSEDNDLIVFEGSMFFDQNVIGAIFFCEKILPLIKKERPDVRLALVGRDPTPEVLALAKDSAVEVTGSVEDIRPYLAKAAVFVCPLQSGGGIKNKILQAWAMGKACVATSFSTGGLGVIEGENILVRDKPQAFADAVLNLMDNPERRKQLGNSGRARVLQNYSWESKAEKIYEMLRTAIGNN